MKFALKKLGRLILLLVVISVLSFILVSNSPIDPIDAYVGADYLKVSPEQREQIAAYWGLNDSKITQFLNWGKALLQGNLGNSLLYKQSVSSFIGERFMASIGLMGMAWLFFGVLGFILGSLSGFFQGKWIDKIIKTYCFTLASTPTFWLGLVLLIIFAVSLGWFPIGFSSPIGVLDKDISFIDRLNHVFLPALTLSIVGVANVALHTREKLIDILNSEYVRFAKAKGESGWKLFKRQALRNTLLPAISLHFASFGELFGGTILVEQVFAYPGLGQAVVEAGLGGDVPLLLGITLFSALFIFTGNLLADILYLAVDPRIKTKADL